MATPAYATSSELDAVNSILMSVGESPVNTLDTQSPEVAIAQKTLRQVCREILSEGWVFNTEYQYPIALDSSSIDKSIIDKEQELVTEELKNSGKPVDIAKKISLGKMKKFKEENALLDLIK